MNFPLNIRGVAPSPRHELLHNLDPYVIAPLTYADTVADGGWTIDVDIKLSHMPHFDTFNTRIMAALRVGDWKILTGPGGNFCKFSQLSLYCPTLTKGSN